MRCRTAPRELVLRVCAKAPDSVQGEGCWLAVQGPPEDRLGAEAASLALESLPPLPLLSLDLPLCWALYPTLGFVPLLDLWSVLRAS